MRDKAKTIMAFAVHHNRIGFVFMIDKQPMDWQMSYKSAKSFDEARLQMKKWLTFYAPDIVLTESTETNSRKGIRAKGLLDAIQGVIVKSGKSHHTIKRRQPYANKYDQIEALCTRFPQMLAVAPKRRKYFEKEPPYVTLFEAVAMAVDYLDSLKTKAIPPDNLPI